MLSLCPAIATRGGARLIAAPAEHLSKEDGFCGQTRSVATERVRLPSWRADASKEAYWPGHQQKGPWQAKEGSSCLYGSPTTSIAVWAKPTGLSSAFDPNRCSSLNFWAVAAQGAKKQAFRNPRNRGLDIARETLQFQPRGLAQSFFGPSQKQQLKCGWPY